MIIKFDPFGVGGASIIQSQIDNTLKLLGEICIFVNSDFSNLILLLFKHNYRPKLVVLQGIFSIKGLIISLVCLLRGIPYVYYSQGSFLPEWCNFYQTNSYFLKNIYWFFFGIAIRSSQFIIVNSEYELLKISRWLKSENKLLLSPWNPIAYIEEKKIEFIESHNFDSLTPLWDESGFSSENSSFVMYSGRVSQEKNINFLLKVWRDIKLEDFNRPTHLVIITSGRKEIKNLIRIIKLKGLKNIVIYEWNSGFDLYLLERAKALVHPSYHESYGLTLIDALSVGTPIVCSKNSMFRDIDRYQLGFSLNFNSTVWRNKLYQILSDKKSKLLENNVKFYLQNLKAKHEYYLNNLLEVLGKEINAKI